MANRMYTWRLVDDSRAAGDDLLRGALQGKVLRLGSTRFRLERHDERGHTTLTVKEVGHEYTLPGEVHNLRLPDNPYVRSARVDRPLYATDSESSDDLDRIHERLVENRARHLLHSVEAELSAA